MEKARHDKAEAAIPRGETTRKSSLRAHLKASRAAIPADERAAIDTAICERLVETSEYEKCEIILTYLSTEREVDTRDLVMRAMASGKHVALPRCVPGTRKMSWHLVKGLDGLVTSSFGIEEPPDEDDTLVRPNTLKHARALAIVPALAFDEAGFRIGYGGGFYDVFLERFPGATVGLCRESSLHASLSAAGALEAHDRAVDLVVTEARVIAPTASGRERRVADE